MNDKQFKKLREEVRAEYKEKYGWADVELDVVQENRYFETIIAIKSASSQDGEVCLYSKKDGVIIFGTTGDLVRHLDMKARQVVSHKEVVVTGIILSCLVIIAGVVFVLQDKEATALVVASIAGILGTYAGAKIKVNGAG